MDRTKEDIKRDVVDELYWDYRVDASEIKVEVSDSTVKLTGTVPSYAAWNAAYNDAWNIDGVSNVTNLLEVKFPKNLDIPFDEEIKNNVKSTLTWHPDIYSLDIDVSVTGGIVRLEGTVDVYWKSWRAEELVSNLRGVIGVENHLSVVPTESLLDKDIAKDIEAALERNLYVDAEDVTVKVENGKVTLIGTAPTYYARGRAQDTAAFTAGVVEVDNNIVVTSRS